MLWPAACFWSPLALRRVVPAATTGTTETIVVVSVVASLTDSLSSAAGELMAYSVVIGAVAALASSLYSRGLFIGVERPPN